MVEFPRHLLSVVLFTVACASCNREVAVDQELAANPNEVAVGSDAQPAYVRPPPRHRPGPDMEPHAFMAGNGQSQVPEGAYSARSGPISDEVMAMENLKADERLLEEGYRLEHESAAKAMEDQTPVNLSPYADEAYREGD